MLALSVIGIEVLTKSLLYYAHEKGWSLTDSPKKGTKKRSVFKTVTWRIVASLDTLIIILFFTGEPLCATSATGLEIILKTIFYYLHERIWNHFRLETIHLDLHTHSTCSDGTLSPQELFLQAQKNNLKYLSITDHDNFDHINMLPGDFGGIKYIPGVEISAEFRKTLHILGYGFDPENMELKNTLEYLQKARRDRNEKMLEKFAEARMPISMDELLEESKGDIVGRPHFARIMEKKSYVASYQEAFDLYLAKGKKFYMSKKRLEPKKAIELILNAGGIPVLAHPYQTGPSGKKLDSFVAELKNHGLKGIEVFYSQHTPGQIREYRSLAKKYDLLITAGSDFHGGNKPHIHLGMTVEKIYCEEFLNKLEQHEIIQYGLASPAN